MPLTANGKIDRKALPEPEGNINTGIEYEAPIGEFEEKLALIWQDILGIKKIGRNDNFFMLGGHFKGYKPCSENSQRVQYRHAS